MKHENKDLYTLGLIQMQELPCRCICGVNYLGVVNSLVSEKNLETPIYKTSIIQITNLKNDSF